MKLWAADFHGYWPVGGCAVVVAETADLARTMLQAKLVAMGLNPNTIDKLREIDLTTPAVHVLEDGDY